MNQPNICIPNSQIEPFTNKSLDILLQMARFMAVCPPNLKHVSRVVVLYTLMKLSRKFGNYKTARQALDQLRLLKAPPQYRSLIDVATLEIRAKPFSDADEFQPMCYRFMLGSESTNGSGGYFDLLEYEFQQFGNKIFEPNRQRSLLN